MSLARSRPSGLAPGESFLEGLRSDGRAAPHAHDGKLSDDGVQQSASIPGDSSTTEVLTIGGSRAGALDAGADHDWYRVSLVAGQSYVFALNGSGGSPLADPYLELYSPSGVLVAIDDDAGPGFNSLLRFTAPTTGVYFVNARAFASEGQPATAGGYTLTGALGPPQNPLDALDLGFTLSTFSPTYYFAGGGETHDSVTASRGWTGNEINAVVQALAAFSAVTPLTFSQAATAAATFVFVLGDLDSGTLGQFSGNSGGGTLAFSPSGAGWSNGLFPGGLGFATLVHEIGHALGLAHPHDNGGNSEILQGVTAEFNSYGTFGLNDGVYTALTYNDGYETAGLPGQAAGGNQAGPMALDIGVLQAKYGANTSANPGSDYYIIPTASLGAYTAIWDVGGIDEIVATQDGPNTIDLRAATLLNETGGGGYVTRQNSNRSGLTIAAGVVIENARGAYGNDLIRGNAAANVLLGYPGNDSIYGGDGDDVVAGQHQDDSLFGEGGADRFWGGDGFDTIFGGDGDDYILGEGDSDTIYGDAGDDVLAGQHGDDVHYGGAGRDRFWGGDGNDVLHGGDGDDELLGEGHNDTLYGDAGADVIAGQHGNDRLEGGDGNDRFWGGDGADLIYGDVGDDELLGEGDNDTLYGGDGNDVLAGQHGDDFVYGGPGLDRAWGGDGNDRIEGEAGNDTLLGEGGNDTILGGDGADVIAGQAGDDYLDGGGGPGAVLANDRIWGGDGSDRILGAAGDDQLRGEGGNDSITGGAGADLLAGGTGVDTLQGGAGDDSLYGDADADVFVFLAAGTADPGGGGGADTVFDFEDGLDILDLRLYAGATLANTTIAASGAADTLVTFAGGETVLLINVDPGLLSASDFLFA